MGQSTSSDGGNSQIALELITKSHLARLFRLRCLQLLNENELSAVADKLKPTADSPTYNPQETSVSREDICSFLGIPFVASSPGLCSALDYLSRLLLVVSTLPFLGDAVSPQPKIFTHSGLLFAAVLLLGRASRVLGNNWDVQRVLFVALALGARTESSPEQKEKTLTPQVLCTSSNDAIEDANDQYSVEVVQTPSHLHTTHDDSTLSKEIRWNTFSVLKLLDDVEVASLQVPVDRLVPLLAFMLIISSVPQASHQRVFSQLEHLFAEKWSQFENAAVLLVSLFSPCITTSTWRDASLTVDVFEQGMHTGMNHILVGQMRGMLERSFLPQKPLDHSSAHQSTKSLYEETRLMNDASLALISFALRKAGVQQTVSTANIVPLFNGSQGGFSLRSLESSIFKWRAPTIFLVSGKRVRQKTISSNRRYQQFDEEYPRFFRPGEQSTRQWQGERDRITYAAYVSSPWQSSNKQNFGDENSVLMSLLPRFDVYPSRKNTPGHGKLVYFNNFGMGIGFGNDQPINKNTTRRIIPGTVSLTIEANLEFAIFRHLLLAGGNSVSFFEKSSQEQVHEEDFEDRFMISDLEVWGVGSTKELDEQRKQWEWEEKQAKARQSVNVRNMGEERAFLEMAGLVGNHAGGGSV